MTLDIEKIKAAALVAKNELSSVLITDPSAVLELISRLESTESILDISTIEYLELHATYLRYKEKYQAAKNDAVRLDYLQELPESVIRLGNSWYWRTGYAKPHKKAKSLREAIDAAMKESV